eukprot:8142832-Pyramimonas_sp.AAC.1
MALQHKTSVWRHAGPCAFHHTLSQATAHTLTTGALRLPQVNLGRCHMNGWGFEPNPVKAAACYRLGGEAGNPIGQYNLGLCYANGWGETANPEKAVRVPF